jgi:putative salt-induced outer membrane protein YdiY
MGIRMFAVMLVLSAVATAETVTLKNGDRLTGAVVKSDGKELVLKTDYAGEIKVQWSAVQDLSSEKKLFVGTSDKRTVEGTVKTEGEELIVNTTTGNAVRVPKATASLIRSEAEQAAYLKSLHPSLTREWAGGLNFGFALARGNSETKNLSLAFNAVRATGNDKISVYANSIYATNDKAGASPSVTANTIFGGIRYDRNVTPRVFVFGALDMQTDDLQRLDLRSIFTGGLGWHAIKTDRTTLDLLSGVNYTRESYSADLTVTPTIPAVTNNYVGLTFGDEFSHKLGAASLFTQRFYIYPNLSSGGGYRTAFDTGLATKLNSWLGWNIGFSDRYTSNPSGDNKKNDILMTTGLGITFKR